MVDIHHFAKQYHAGEAHVRSSNISERNKELILRYRDACLLHGTCGQVRLIRVFHVLLRSAVALGKEFDTITRPDLETLIASLLRRGCKPATVATYKAILKRFLGWVLCPEEFPRIRVQPPVIAWMTVHVKRRDEQRLQRTELLTPTDIERLLAVCHNPRDRALMSMLWETGCRISEVGNLEVRHITPHEHGYILDVDGKTGRRSPLIVSSAPHLAVWLSHHPCATRRDAPLWVHYQYRNATGPIDYDTIRTLLLRHFRRAGIVKPFHPHIFRHSRATYVLARGIMTDAQARVYFGWTPDSTMIGRYAHLVDADAHNALLKENNLLPITPAPNALMTKRCHRCATMNMPSANFCTTCTANLDERALYAGGTIGTHQLVMELARLLVERGFLDEATDELHRANFGSRLKALINDKEQRS